MHDEKPPVRPTILIISVYLPSKPTRTKGKNLYIFFVKVELSNFEPFVIREEDDRVELHRLNEVGEVSSTLSRNVVGRTSVGVQKTEAAEQQHLAPTCACTTLENQLSYLR